VLLAQRSAESTEFLNSTAVLAADFALYQYHCRLINHTCNDACAYTAAFILAACAAADLIYRVLICIAVCLLPLHLQGRLIHAVRKTIVRSTRHVSGWPCCVHRSEEYSALWHVCDICNIEGVWHLMPERFHGLHYASWNFQRGELQRGKVAQRYANSSLRAAKEYIVVD
jgi:hypothetical protein